MSDLKSCEACGHDIAKGARMCPHCGKTYTTWSGVVLAALIGLLLAGGCGYLRI
jgi:RNA polymerase subunit RPABC4/transcription elongation factor Spt4